MLQPEQTETYFGPEEALWNDFEGVPENDSRTELQRPGLSLLEREELTILDAISHDPEYLAQALLVKAVFGGSFIPEEGACLVPV